MVIRRSGWALGWLLLAGCASSLKSSQVEELGRRGDLPGLLDAWERAQSDAVRATVLEQLAAFPDSEQGRALIGRQLRPESGESVKQAALRAAERLPGPGLMSPVVQMLGDPLPQVRELAYDLLAKRSGEAAEPVLAALGQSPSHLVRAGCARLVPAVAQARPELRGGGEELLLRAGAKDDTPKVREAAAAALGTLEVARARPVLLELMRTDPDSGVRIAAQRAIQKLGEGALGSAVVAVLPLKNDTGDPELDRLCHQVAEYVAARLSREKVCQVVDSSKFERALEEMKKRGVLLYDGDDPNAPELGRFKIANQLVYGTVQRNGALFTIVLNRMDVATLAQVPGAAVTVQGYKVELEQLKLRAADLLVASFR